jgi:predicted amidohydrolase
VHVIWTDLLLHAEKAAREAIKEGPEVVCFPDVAFSRATFTVSDQSGAAAESIEAARAAHRGYAVVIQDVTG